MSHNATTYAPRLWIGAYSPGALALPPAHPTPSQLYAPRGVYLDDDHLIVVDSGNHRVMIWHGVPTNDGQAADVVLGQPSFTSEGPQAGGRGARNGFHLPTGVLVIAGRLYIADAWHHRILVWDRIPETSDTPPDSVIGQDGFAAVHENHGGGEPDATSLYWPYGIAYIAGWFYIADTGNRRVLGWDHIPEPNEPATLILGQATPHDRLENRGAEPSADSFRWPHAIAGNAERLYVADAGNHRVFGWSPRPLHDQPADLVIGQPDFQSNHEIPYIPPGPQRLRFPYALAFQDDMLAVADTANNRILLWNHAPTHGAFHPADQVIGQPDFAGNGENHWRAVTHETLCWPYGIHLHRNTIAIADSGNNRVVVWETR